MSVIKFDQKDDDSIIKSKILSDEEKEFVLATRNIARDVILRLEPEHLTGIPSLIEILEQGILDAKSYLNDHKAKFYNKI